MFMDKLVHHRPLHNQHPVKTSSFSKLFAFAMGAATSQFIRDNNAAGPQPFTANSYIVATPVKRL